jgi:hypothetical protein
MEAEEMSNGTDGPGGPIADAMTPIEFALKMGEISRSYSGDPEAAHGKADDLMCEMLRSLGYGDGVNAFEAMDKWYA